MPRDPKSIVASGYDGIAERYATWCEFVRVEERAYYTNLVLHALPAGARILELGCGSGGSTTRAFAGKFTLTGVDLSERHVKLARGRIPNARFIKRDMTELQRPPGMPFDAIAAFYSTVHVPRRQHSALCRRVASWLRPGGLFVASFEVENAETDINPNWLGVQMYWSGYDASTTCKLVHAAGLVIDESIVRTADEDGESVSFLWVVAHRVGGRRE